MLQLIPEGKTVMRVSSRTSGRESLIHETCGSGFPTTRQLKSAVCPGNNRKSFGCLSKGGRSVKRNKAIHQKALSFQNCLMTIK